MINRDGKRTARELCGLFILGCCMGVSSYLTHIIYFTGWYSTAVMVIGSPGASWLIIFLVAGVCNKSWLKGFLFSVFVITTAFVITNLLHSFLPFVTQLREPLILDPRLYPRRIILVPDPVHLPTTESLIIEVLVCAIAATVTRLLKRVKEIKIKIVLASLLLLILIFLTRRILFIIIWETRWTSFVWEFQAFISSDLSNLSRTFAPYDIFNTWQPIERGLQEVAWVIVFAVLTLGIILSDSFAKPLKNK